MTGVGPTVVREVTKSGRGDGGVMNVGYADGTEVGLAVGSASFTGPRVSGRLVGTCVGTMFEGDDGCGGCE